MAESNTETSIDVMILRQQSSSYRNRHDKILKNLNQ